MYQFFSSLSDREINRRYLDKFRLPSFNRKFDSTVASIRELDGFFPDDYKGSNLLTESFTVLTHYYYRYLNLVGGLTDARKADINRLLAEVFNYDAHKNKIRNFLLNPDNGFEIHNCVYCDLHHFSRYRVAGSVKIDFHADHVLDEGKCPLVGLSIHNFVPSCPTCNEGGNKGINTLGRDKRETLRISPKSRLNKFISEVEFYYTPDSSVIKDLKMYKGNFGWEIDLKYKKPEYFRTIDLFHLKERYNAEKQYFGKYIYKKLINPPAKIKEDARLRGITYEEQLEELFGYQEKRRSKAAKEKCRLDLLK